MTIVHKLKDITTTAIFYPIFLIIYIAYSVSYRIACLVQHVFKVVYIQHFCGFKRKQKIIDAINELSKKPEDLTLVFDIQQYGLEKNGKIEVIQNALASRILENIDIFDKVNGIKNLNILVTSKGQVLQDVIQMIEKRLEPSEKTKIKFITQYQKQQAQVQKLLAPQKSYAPFIIVFSKYQTTCSLPSKYLVNAQIAFNPSLFSSTKYDLYRSFSQYSSSKQRNGK